MNAGVVLLALGLTQAAAHLRPAAPVEPLTGIFNAFRTHRIVAMSGGHHDPRGHALVLSLIRDPRFADTVNDIVVECCSARYQEIIDRFVGGEDLSEESLAPAWRNSTQVNAHQRDAGTALELFRAVRALNARRPGERQVRVLFGDPPIDWDTVRSAADHRKWLEQRDAYPADLILREVLAKNRKALVIYGGMHLQRRNLIANYASDGLAETLIGRVERMASVRAFTIWGIDPHRLQADVALWPVPSLVLVRATRLGAIDFADYYGGSLQRIAMSDGKPDFAAGPVPQEQWRKLPMEDQFDAVLYLGPASNAAEFSGMSPDMCTDTEYMPVLRARMALVGLKPEIDRLNRYCAHVQTAR